VAYRKAPSSGARGMGDAPFPCAQDDLACQSAFLNASLPISVPGPCYGAGGSIVACPVAGQTTNLLPSALGPYGGVGTDPLSQLSALFSQNPAIAWGLGIFAGLMLLSSMGRR
jgi:hypothetical protein